MNSQRRIDGKDLHFFPKYVPKIEEKEREYEKTIQKNLVILKVAKISYEKVESFGYYIFIYGKALLDNGYLAEAGLMLSCVYGSENWDNMFPLVLDESIEDDYVVEILYFLYKFRLEKEIYENPKTIWKCKTRSINGKPPLGSYCSDDEILNKK